MKFLVLMSSFFFIALAQAQNAQESCRVHGVGKPLYASDRFLAVSRNEWSEFRFELVNKLGTRTAPVSQSTSYYGPRRIENLQFPKGASYELTTSGDGTFWQGRATKNLTDALTIDLELVPTTYVCGQEPA